MKRIKTHTPKGTRIITREEESKMVALLRCPDHYAERSYYADVADLVEVMADTGMRLGELLELRKEDISFEKSFITVRVTKYHPRRVPMTRRVVAVLKRRHEVGHDKPFGFNQHQIHRAWSWAREKIGIEGADRLILYSLRKSCVQRLIDAGVEPEILYAWLGFAAIGKERRSPHLPLHKLTAAAEMLDATSK